MAWETARQQPAILIVEDEPLVRLIAVKTVA
jgi:hypothetical protein